MKLKIYKLKIVNTGEILHAQLTIKGSFICIHSEREYAANAVEIIDEE